MPMYKVVDKEIARIKLYATLPWFMRLDVVPFALFYSTLLYQYVALQFQLDPSISIPGVADPIFSNDQVVYASKQQQHKSNEHLLSIVFILTAFLHILAFLLSQWNIQMKTWIGYYPVANIQSASVVKAVPIHLEQSPQQICRLERNEKQTDVKMKGLSVPDFWFVYQKVTFCLFNDAEKEQNTFTRLDYPTNRTISEYISSKGYSSESEIAIATQRWGTNEFDIPLPPFLELFKEHAVAPFFVFQIFCVLLWCLDEYVYYSLMTLCMLVLLECIVVKQRQSNMESLRCMRRPSQPCYVYRSSKWQRFNTDKLLPGDICSIRPMDASNDSFDTSEMLVPCDMLLLRGSCVVNEAMLSGESIPLRKEAIAQEMYETDEKLHVDDGTSMRHKKHVIYGGTKVLQHQLRVETSGLRGFQVPNCPDGGCPAFVLRTGFATTQGNLMRTILYSAERVSANNPEALSFILFLLMFATAASGYVLYHGIQDDTRNRFKLLLHCIMIVTSVVPPELPMELTLAVNNSLIALSRKNVFCTEPFRIPFAGKVDVCCFDKTGTLTSDTLNMHGVAPVVGSKEDDDCFIIHPPESISRDAQIILAGCHSLVTLHANVSGDPLEKEAFSKIGWRLGRDDHVLPPVAKANEEKMPSFRILQRFAFTSDLKRMSALLALEENDAKAKTNNVITLRLVTKGAPEVLESLFDKVPTAYHRVQKYYASKGCRVLALGHRDFDVEYSEIRSWARSRLETKLTFSGLLILDCPLKVDSKKTMQQLRLSSHRLMMLTGDNAFTACDVARQVGICSRTLSSEMLILSVINQGSAVAWLAINDGKSEADVPIPFDIDDLEQLQRSYDLCVTGSALTFLTEEQDVVDAATATTTTTTTAAAAAAAAVDDQHVVRYLACLKKISPFVQVFARTSPQQKEYIVAAMNQTGLVTVMCGDGTNDVGALKQAHVGVSIINNPHMESQMHPPPLNVQTHLGPLKKQSLEGNVPSSSSALRKRRGEKGENGTMTTTTTKKSLMSNGGASKAMEALQRKLDEDMDVSMVKLGDASIASPFTSKSPSVQIIVDIIRQGRCTLVTTIQMFKILGINCLVTAYMLSSLFLQGVKQGDQQMTIFGLIVAMFFLFISRSNPTPTLSVKRPISRVFSTPVMASILGQFIIHLMSLMYMVEACQPYIDKKDPSMHPDGKFVPNVINTTVFLLGWLTQVNTFVANYQGHPFMERLQENKLLWRSALASYAVIVCIVFEVFPFMSSIFELVPLPSELLRMQLITVMLLDTLGVTAYETLVKWLLQK